MINFLKFFSTMLVFSLFSQPQIAQSWDEAMKKAFEFCESNGYDMTEAYIESQNYIAAVCSKAPLGFNHQTEVCYTPGKYFIVVQSIPDNKILELPTWPKKYGNRFPYIYTFESVLNGIHYQIKTTGGSNSYDPNNRFWTSVLLKKGSQVIYSNRINHYYGNIGMGC